MTYEETIDYLYRSAPLFQNIGAGAYKEGLSNTHLLDAHFNHPHRHFRTIHVGGTNGKGSVCHTLAAILQSAGYRTGLFTSPHLLDFRERIRVNGEMISQKRVIDFVEQERAFFEPLHPSFFELTTALAFKYFEEEKVDVAVVEVGMGGRLDCTNIIQPCLSIITNISFDHMQFLGHTLPHIAREKAGIIKANTPVVIGECKDNTEVKQVFADAANKCHAPICFADEEGEIIEVQGQDNHTIVYSTRHYGTLIGTLTGDCQTKNTATILSAVNQLIQIGFELSKADIKQGMLNVEALTHLQGRWQKIADSPLTICDTGHNTGGMQYIVKQLNNTPHRMLHIVIGMVNDKDITTILGMMPKSATYYFTQAGVARALPAKELAQKAATFGLCGNSYHTVNDAYKAAKALAKSTDLVFIGGSTFVVADLLKHIP